MKTHKAKRIDSGSYEYRGYTIDDHGAGNSVAAAINRNGHRWRIRRITGPGYFDSEYVGGAYSFRDAKQKVDSWLAAS